MATRFLHFEETNDYAALQQVVVPEIKWRQRGLLQGNTTLRGIDQVRYALQTMHAHYQDLKCRVNLAAEEVDKVVLYWTASGVNRVGIHGQPPSFRKSVFSGVSIMYLAPDGRVREVIEYRQPTREEMQAYFRKDAGPATKTLLESGHVVPGDTAGQPRGVVPVTVDPSWRSRAVAIATEWVENWTPGPDLEQMVREDFEEFNRYSWPDFEGDVAGKDALAERAARPTQEAVAILDTIADSSTNIIAVLWNDFQHVDPDQEAADALATGEPTAQASTSSSERSSASSSGSGSLAGGLPESALPRRQPAMDASHGGSVQLKDGHLRVTLNARKTLSSVDDNMPKHLHKFSGATLFQVDPDGKMAWSVTFRELNAREKARYVLRRDAALAAQKPNP